MANEPSASDILNFRVDPEQGGETPVPLLKENSAINQLNINARYSAENKARKYYEMLDNLKDLYKNLGNVSALETYTPDREYLQKETQKIYSDIGNNPKAIYSPEIQGRVSKLISDATESKLNRVYDFAHREFIARNPELNTEANQQKFDQFSKQPLGKREAFGLDVPVMFDPSTLRKEIFESPDVKRAVADLKFTPDGSGVVESTGFDFLKQNFLDKWNSALSYEQDKYGKPIMGWAKEQFDKLSPQQQQMFGGSVDKFWQKLGEDAFGSPQDFSHTTKKNYQSNPNFLKKEQLAQEQSKLAETIRNNKADEGLAFKNYKLNSDKFLDETKGAEESKSAAVGFATGLLNDLLSKGSIKTKDGGAVLTPDDLNKLTVEQLKFLGKELPSERDPSTGAIIKSGGLNPLLLGKDEQGKDLGYDEVIEVTPNGDVMVMKNAKFDPTKGIYKGDWDNNKSTSIWNAARNLLNEENTKSGNKERNAYVPLDLKDKSNLIQTDVSGGGKKTAGTFTYKKSEQNSKGLYPLPAGQPKDIEQNGFKYTWDEKTGTYQ